MAQPSNTVYAGLQESFQALVEAVQRGDDPLSLQQKQRNIVMLTDTARQLNLLGHERAESLRSIEQLDIQNTLTTLGRLLELQRQLNEVVVEGLNHRLENITLRADRLEESLARNTLLAEENIHRLEERIRRLTYTLPTVNIRTISGSVECGRAFCGLKEGFIANGERDGMIKIWNSATWQLEAQIQAHDAYVAILTELENRTLVSVSKETVKFWQPSTWNLVRTIQIPHTKRITALREFEAGKVVVGTVFGGMHIWDIETGRPIQILQNHTDSIFAFTHLQDRTFVSGSMKEIIVWEAGCRAIRRTINAGCMSLTPVDQTLIAVTHYQPGPLKIFNLTSGGLEREITVSEHTDHTCRLLNGTLACASYYRSNAITLVDPLTGITKGILQTTSGVTGLVELTNGMLASGSQEGIRLWR